MVAQHGANVAEMHPDAVLCNSDRSALWPASPFAARDAVATACGAALEELKGVESSHPDVLLLTAQVLLERGKLDESMIAATRCVELASTQADCWLTLGVLHQNAKDKDAAIAAYEKYLNLAPWMATTRPLRSRHVGSSRPSRARLGNTRPGS